MNSDFDSIKVDVIVCIHNALADVSECLKSILAADYPSENLRVILIDDGSDIETENYLKNLSDINKNIQLHRSEVATGYTCSANRGLKVSTAEVVVLLNSDTIVPRSWLKKMLKVFQKNGIGLVGPLSNAATWQSIPKTIGADGKFAINELIDTCDIECMNKYLEEIALPLTSLPRVPLLNGFCIMMRRQVFEEIGFLDEESFPSGYGEENDFCFRASDAGYGLCLATDTYVFHAKSKSFGHERRLKLSKQGNEAFHKKYNKHRIQNAVETMRYNPILETLRKEISNLI